MSPAVLGLVVGVIALILPPHALAAAMAGPGALAAHLAQVVTGVWLLKGILLLHAVLLLLASRFHWLAPSDKVGLAPRGITVRPVPPTTLERTALALILVLGTALRLPSLGRGLWFDEIQTVVESVRLPLVQILTTFNSQNQHMLYSVLARLTYVAGGAATWTVRVPALVFGVASLAAIAWFGARVTARREALLAALLLAVSYHHVWFSQNARGYTGLLFFTLVGSGCFLLLLAEPERHTVRRVVIYALSMALAHFVHITAVFVTVSHAVVLAAVLISRRDDLRNRAWVPPVAALVLAGTLSLLLYALVLPQFLATLLTPPDAGSATAWKDPLWMVTEAVRVLSAGIPGGLITVAAGLAIIGIGVASYWRRSATATTIMLLPALCTGAAILVLSHNLWPRFFFFSAGFAVLIVVRGGFAIVCTLVPRRNETVATVGAVAVAVLSLTTVPRAWSPKQDFEGARTFVESHRNPGDGVAGVDMTGYVYTRYDSLPWPALKSPEQLGSIEATHPQTWVIVTFPIRLEKIQPKLWEHLTHTYRTAATFPGTVGGGALFVMVSR